MPALSAPVTDIIMFWRGNTLGQSITRTTRQLVRFGGTSLLLGLMLITIVPIAPAKANDTGERVAMHRQALALARAGKFSPALHILEQLLARYPRHSAYLYDYITVSGWAEHDDQVLRYLPQLNLAEIPPYVLETLAKAARNTQQYPLAIELYRRDLQRYPQRLPATLGLALALTDNGKTDKALTLLNKLAQQRPRQQQDILKAQAYVHELRHAYFDALKTYELILAASPTDRDALRGRILITAKLGAPHLAADMAARHPGLLSSGELATIRQNQTAIAIRWGRLPAREQQTAEKETAQAVSALENRLHQLNEEGKGESADALHARYDLIVALDDRFDMHRAIALYEELPISPAAIPPYVLTAVAGAYLYAHQPAKARDLLLQTLQQTPGNFDASLSLVYAYVENEEFPPARQLIQYLAEQQPIWLGKASSPYRRENPNKLLADTTAALVEAFADNLSSAQLQIEKLVNNAPNNAELRSEQASIYLWRGWPHRARDEYQLALGINPQNLGVQAGQGEALLALADYRGAHQTLQKLQQYNMARPPVRRLMRHWQLHNMRQLRVETGYNKSSGSQEGSRDLTLDAWLYARPWKYRYRPFVHSHLASSRFPEGTENFKRLGIGVEYRTPVLELVSELNRDIDSSVNPGLSLQSLWKPDDHWRLGASYDSNSNDIPLRGRFNEDIDGWSAGIDAGYYFHESRRIETGLQYLDFSDGNTRKSAHANLFQRLISHPHYKLEGMTALYGSRNSRKNAPYFNPHRDLSFDITLTNEWLQYRHYERAFRHRLATTLGVYDQSSFGSNLSWMMRYEQQWNANDRFELRYGVAYDRKIYDGAAEHDLHLDLNLDWRF